MNRSLFTKRIFLKPYEYPELLDFKDAIRNSYWIHTEFNFTGDIQDFRVNVTPTEKSVITRAILSISQVEVTVKRYWGDLYYIFPKPEIDAVGATFADSEVRHQDAYSFLLEKLGMNELFLKIPEFEPLMKRIEYMDKFMRDRNLSKQQQIISLALFSMFIEHNSLFSQFLIIMSFNKHKTLFKGISNAVEATSKEEEIHGKFGIELYRILRTEHSDLFTPEFFAQLEEMSNEAFKAEMDIVDWIFEEGDLSFITKAEVKNYLMHRYNNSLQNIGLEGIYEVDKKLLERTKWFDEEILATKENDFFNKRSTDYSKKQKEFTEDDLF